MFCTNMYQNYTLIKTHEHWRHMFCTNVYQNYTLIKTHEHWWHMFCTNVYQNYTLIKTHAHWWHMFCTNVYQNYTLIKTHEHWWHMFCTNVCLTTNFETDHLENDEIKKCTGYVGGFIFLKQGDLYSYYFGNLLRGYVSLRILQYHAIL